VFVVPLLTRTVIMNIPGDLDQYIHGDIVVPSIIVISTELAKQSIETNFGMSLSDLLTPFGGYYTPITAQYRVLDKSPFRLNGFKVRFVDPTQTACTSSLAEQEATTAVLSAQPIARESLFGKWFGAFSKNLQWTSFDCLNQPIATVLIVSSGDANIIEAFEQLSHVANQPDLCRSGLLDPTSSRVKLLLHTDPLIPQETVDKTMAQLRTIYTQNSVIFLPILGASTDEGVQAAIYPAVSRTSSCISWTDVERLNLCVEQIVCGNALPWLERKISQLDANITAKRKGLRNQLKNFLRTDPQPFVGGNLSLQQVEWQCRLAGDIAFHLRAYDTAFGYYRNVCGDLKQEKSTILAAAGCYEMSGLSGFLAGVAYNELVRFFDTAIELYITGNKAEFAIRAGIFQAIALRGRPEAADKLIKLNGLVQSNNWLRSAVLLDQAARLHAATNSRRKEAFTQVLAGHMFNKVEGGREWALSAYSSVLNVYGPDWTCIRDHLLFTMAKLDYGLSKFQEAFGLLKELFHNAATGSMGSSVEKHTNYVKLFMYVVKSLGETSELARNNFSLPIVWIARIETDSIVLKVKNPLLVPVDVDRLRAQLSNDGVCEESGQIQLGPLEEREVELMVSGEAICDNQKIISIQWTLFGLIEVYV
jgi:hypothetical protein